MVDVEVVPLDAALESDYDAFLNTTQESLFYYSLRYKRFLETLLDCDPKYHLALEDRLVTGVLPIMEKDGPHGRIVNSLPYYGSNGGAIAATAAASSALRAYYLNRVGAPDVGAATWIENPLAPLEVTHDLVDSRIGHFTNLAGVRSEQDVLEHIEGSARRNVKTARAQGLSIGVENDMLDFLEHAHTENMTAMGGNAKSNEFFRGIPDAFEAGSDYELFVARREREPVAALLVFYFNRTVEYFTPATLSDERKAQPMALILLEAMTGAAIRGFTRWNWGGTWHSQDGVARFKRKWGAEEMPYRYFVTVNDQELLRARPEELASHYPGFYVVPYDRLRST